MWKISEGIRKPDIYLWNGGHYVIESKWSKRDHLEAMTKIYDKYMKLSSELSLSGGFAILYPEQLSKIIRLIPDIEKARARAKGLKYTAIAIYAANDGRNVERFEGTVSQLAEWIAIRVKQPSRATEPDIKFIIDVLRHASTQLKSALGGISENSIVEMFGGKSVFENILQYEEKKYPVEEMMHAAAYILINQIVFYHVLSQHNKELRELDEDKVRHPGDLYELYFKKVLDEINYSVVFNYSISPKIPQENLDTLKSVVKVVKAISPEKVRHDVLGTIFHDLIPLEIRKGVAAYYTNVLAAELLASLAIKESSESIADFASGSGGLLSAAYRSKRMLLKRPLTFEDHKRFIEQDLLGIDVMAFASHMTAINLSFQSPRYIDLLRN